MKVPGPNPKAEILVRLVAPSLLLSQHAPITHQHNLLQAKACAQLVELGRHGLGLGGVAFEHLTGHRTTLDVSQHPQHNLWIAAPLVARVTIVRQRTAVPSK
jgi:hypothetical protein